jgi:hypothetical protein
MRAGGIRRAATHWFVRDVLFPFAWVRAALLWMAWWTQQYPPAADYPTTQAVSRGWNFVPNLYLDVWGRWDTGWYLGIATHGYAPAATVSQSSVAFFPAYPVAIGFISRMVGGSPEGMYACAVALSNLAAIAALATLFVLVRDTWTDEALARRTVLYILVFPAGFFLSCAYSESLFLLLSAGAFLAAHRKRWWIAGALAALGAVTRATGILLTAPLAWAYLSEKRWSLREVRADVTALLLAPSALAIHAWSVGRLTGDPFALLHAQAGWGRKLSPPWVTLSRKGHNRYVGHFDRFSIVGISALVARLPVFARPEWTLYAALSLLPVLLSGVPLSATRLLSVVFPAFIPLAELGRNERVHFAIVVGLLTIQIAFFTSWSRFYWAD